MGEKCVFCATVGLNCDRFQCESSSQSSSQRSSTQCSNCANRGIVCKVEGRYKRDIKVGKPRGKKLNISKESKLPKVSERIQRAQPVANDNVKAAIQTAAARYFQQKERKDLYQTFDESALTAITVLLEEYLKDLLEKKAQ
jgi:hypothetical protein